MRLATLLLLFLPLFSISQTSPEGGCWDHYSWYTNQMRDGSVLNSHQVSNTWEYNSSGFDSIISSWDWHAGDTMQLIAGSSTIYEAVVLFKGPNGDLNIPICTSPPYWNAPAYFAIQEGIYTFDVDSYYDMDCGPVSLSNSIRINVEQRLDSIVAAMPALTTTPSIDKFDEELKVGPNPANNVVTVQFKSPGTLSITNLSGKRLLNEKIESKYIKNIDVSDYKKGIYIISFVSQDYSRITKLVVN